MEMNLPYSEEYKKAARAVVAEGAVLLKNDDGALPLKEGMRIAMLGRCQYEYVKSGTGSGGLVNPAYVVSIRNAFENSGCFTLDEELDSLYKAYIAEHPFDKGHGWATEPWFQDEMPLTDEIVRAASERNDVAIVVIGRLAGEEKDNRYKAGSYLLTEKEEDDIRLAAKYFKKTVVLLNVGAVIDMSWVEKYDPSAVLYVWQGGQEGGNGVYDVLTGAVTPCGKLPDTIVKRIVDIPSTYSYGGIRRNFYEEDIYVGYRYFETFDEDKVVYPFGYGISYTTFDIKVSAVKDEGRAAVVRGSVKNTGAFPGKEIVEIYCGAPVGKLGKPKKSLCGFTKTKVLQPGETAEFEVEVPWYYVSSYDDGGYTGEKSAYVLEEGDYVFYAGADVRSAAAAGSIYKPYTVVEKLRERMAPSQAFRRFKMAEDGSLIREDVPLCTYDKEARRIAELPEEIPQTGDKGYKLSDVKAGNVSMDEFIAQLSDEDLFAIVRGEGPGSDKVTAACIGSFGGVTESLKQFGIPIACMSDGPSGIRRDNGAISFLNPNGVLIASTWNTELVRELYTYEGKELHDKKIESLLGPGMNIHRNPLNGRNFEYFSEDPFIAGKIAAAELQGMHKGGATGTIKHFCCNNQEADRFTVESVVSERALREIYMKQFEIAIKEGDGDLIMTTYNPTNDYWNGSNYDLTTGVLREEWGFKGVVMSDWWAYGNFYGEEGWCGNVAAAVMAQNDVFMLIDNSGENSGNDNSAEELAKGRVKRAEYQRSAKNICAYLLNTQCMDRIMGINEPGVPDIYAAPIDDSYKQITL